MDIAIESMEAIMDQDPIEEASARFATSTTGGDNAAAFDEVSRLVRDFQDIIQIQDALEHCRP